MKATTPALTPLRVRANTKHDWQAIRHDYVVMGLSREEVLQKHEVPARLFDYHAKEGHWLALKLDIEQRLKAQLKGLPQIPDELLAAVDAQWRQRYRELERMTVYIERWLAAHGDAAAPAEIQRLTQAQRNIIQMQRLLMGESTENLGLVDQAVEQVLALVDRYVPEADKERFRNDVARIVHPAALLPAAR